MLLSARETPAEAPPRILLVTGGLDCGGAQRVLADMANHWAEKNWQIQLATWSGPEVPDFYALSARVSRVWLAVPSRSRSPQATLLSTIERIFKLRRLLRGSRPGAVISFIDISNIHTIIAAAGLGIRVVVSERTNPSVNFKLSWPWKVLRRLCYSSASQVVAQTKDAAMWLEHHCRTRVAVIPNSLRTLPYLNCGREACVVAVGRLSAEKGYDVLLRAFARTRNVFPQWRLIMIGDGPERLDLELVCRELGLGDHARFLGQIENVEEWLARCGLMVHASRREGFPNAVLEAMAMGAPVICTNCPSGPSELIQDGVNGRLVPVGDVDALAEVMSELMAQSDVRENLGRAAMRVRQQYDPAVIMEKWEECVLGTPMQSLRAQWHPR